MEAGSHYWRLHVGAHYCQANFFRSEVHSSKYYFLVFFVFFLSPPSLPINKSQASWCLLFSPAELAVPLMFRLPAVITAVKDGREVQRVESSAADRLEAVQENCARSPRTSQVSERNKKKRAGLKKLGWIQKNFKTISFSFRLSQLIQV